MQQSGTEVFFDLADTIDKVRDTDLVPELLSNIVDLYGLKSVAYLGIGTSRIEGPEPFIAVTYSAEWIKHYKEQGYLYIDPVIKEGFSRILPIDWNEFKTGQQTKRFLGEAEDFGLGRNGLSFPVRGMWGERAVITITSDASQREWNDVSRFYMRDFQALSGHLHEMVLRTGSIDTHKISLTSRQVECLWWTSRGKNVPEIALILGLSRYTVKDYLEGARIKLNATSNGHAAFKAAQLGLLFPRL